MPMPLAPARVSAKDRNILRQLAAHAAEIGNLPVQKEKTELWRRLNQLEEVRPLVWINEIPWHEMNVDNELTIKTRDPFCQGIEGQLRTLIYQWEHMRGDMVVEPIFRSPLVVRNSGFGMVVEEDLIPSAGGKGVPSHRYHCQFEDEKDVEKIKMPEVTLDEDSTERNCQTLVDTFGDLLPVQKYGVGMQWFAPWDALVMWWNPQQALMDLAMKPELVHAAMDRLVNAYLHCLSQYEKLNVLSFNNGNFRIGSGGLGYTDELPQKDARLDHIRTVDQWGCATAQIFSEVSPAMHEEFALQYERKWLKRFGLTYYGCCEPLHLKLDILKSVPNLRKISMSPWAKPEKYVEKLGRHYVLSHKPNPAVLATDDWNPAQARDNLTEVLDKVRGCVVEVILKDISTVRNHPQRLWKWEKVAMETVAKYG